MIKKRYYHYPSPVAIDKFNTRVLKALSTKLTRDYLEFFGSLSKLYTKGEQKKRLTSVVGKVRKSIILLENMISIVKVSKGDIRNLIENVEEINEARDYFLSQAEQNKSLEEKIQKVSEATGVSPQDLNVTKEIIHKGASQVRKRTKEGVLPFLKRTMPEVMELGAELRGGMVTALAGPLAPAIGMAKTAVKGAVGIGSGLLEKRRERQEERLSGQLAPMAAGLQPSALRQLRARRAEHPFATNFEGISRRVPTSRRQSKEESVLPLTYFFDKKAHKAKWTKELLNRFKKMEKKLGVSRTGRGLLDMPGLGGLVKKFSLLGAAILPLLGPAGALLGLGAASIFAGDRLGKLAYLTGEYWGALKNVKRHEEKQVELQKKLREKEVTTLSRKMITAKTPVERANLAAQLKVNQKEREKALIKEGRIHITESGGVGRAWETWKSGASSLLGIGGGEPPVPTRPELAAEEAIFPTKGTSVFSRNNEEAKQGMLAIEKAVNRMNDTLSRQRGSGVKGSSLGDPFGVGDPLMIPWSNGQLSLGDD